MNPGIVLPNYIRLLSGCHNKLPLRFPGVFKNVQYLKIELDRVLVFVTKDGRLGS